MHVAFLQVIVHFIPLTSFADDDYTFIPRRGSKNFGSGIGLFPKTQGCGSHKTDSIHLVSSGKGGNSQHAGKQNQGQSQRGDSFCEFHMYPPG